MFYHNNINQFSIIYFFTSIRIYIHIPGIKYFKNPSTVVPQMCPFYRFLEVDLPLVRGVIEAGPIAAPPEVFGAFSASISAMA